jgi:hypothetical protein
VVNGTDAGADLEQTVDDHRAEVRGEVIYEPAMDAVKEAVSRGRCDELILSTPSAGVCTLVRFDLYRRARRLGVPTTHLVERKVRSSGARRVGWHSHPGRPSASATS